MDRHVIKGRGMNRGKYLCWGRMAPSMKPTEDGFVWLPLQRKAARFADPQYSGHTWATDRARLHNGYFVKLTTPKPITGRVADLCAFIADHAAGAEDELACHWIHGSNEEPVREAIRDLDRTGWNGDFDGEGANFCADCMDEVLAALRALLRAKRTTAVPVDDDDDDCGICSDGGWDTEHDSTPFCAKCGVKLSGNQTDYCTDEEISALTDYAAPDFNDPNGWRDVDNAITNLADDDPRWRKIAKIVDAAREAEREHESRAAALAVSPGMPETRAALLSLLGARAEQKAPEPSFRLWDDLCAFLALDSDTRIHNPTPEIEAQERRLVKEARRFTGHLGWGCYWSGDSLIIDAPYGSYYFTFVVKIEQWRLWQPKPFQEGRAYMLHPCPSGDPEWPHHRDANPYPDGSEESQQWDAGYIGSTTRAPSR